MESSKEHQQEEILTGLPPVPENEFCVFGTVIIQPHFDNSI